LLVVRSKSFTQGIGIGFGLWYTFKKGRKKQFLI